MSDGSLPPLKRPRAEVPAALKALCPAGKPVMAFLPAAQAGGVAEIQLYGVIGFDPWADYDEEQNTATNLVAQIEALGDQPLLVRVSSAGGDVFEGLPIANALRAHKGQVTTRCEGIAASMAVDILMAGDVREAYAGAVIMTHSAWSVAMGDAQEMRAQADALDTINEARATFYAGITGKSAEAERSALLDGGDHWFTAEQFQQMGYLTAIVPDDKAAATPTPSARAVEAIKAAFPHATPAGAVAMARLFTPAPAASAAPTPVSPPAPAPIPSPTTAQEQPTMTTVPQPAGAEPTPAPADTSAAVNAALAADGTRRAEIKAAFQPHMQRVGIQAILDGALDDPKCSPDTARGRLLELIGSQASPTARMGDIVVGTEPSDVFRANAGEFLMHRVNPAKHQMTAGAREFRGSTMVDLARQACELANIPVRGRPAEEIVKMAMISTSDMPTLLTQTVTRTLQEAYLAQPKTYQSWAKRADFTNFKEVKEAIFAPNVQMKKVAELEEYTLGTTGESAEPIRVGKYGRLFAYSWEAMVNDDLNALTRLPEAFGNAAGTLESDLAYRVLAVNAATSDGFPLFSATPGHANLGAIAPLSEASVEAATIYFNNRRTPQGDFMNLQPQVILVPPSLAFLARRIFTAPYSSQGVGPQATQTPNIIKDLYDIVVDPRVAGGYPDPNTDGLVPAQNAYYFFANPQSAPVVRYGYLQGYETPTVEQLPVNLVRDSITWKGRHCFGAGAVGSIGAYKVATA